MSNDCENVIAETGWGFWHYFLIILCGFISFAEASTSLTVPIVLPLIECDFKFGGDQVTLPVASYSFGMAIGAFVFGTISDTIGRKILLPITMCIVFYTSICLSFAQTKFLINLSIFVLGLGVAGNNAVLRVYLIESLPTRKRGTGLAIIDMFWVVGYLLALGFSWFLMPFAIRSIGKQALRPSSWRVLAAICGSPSLVIACVSGLLPPSPRHLLYRRRPGRALQVLRQMYAINNSKHIDNYPIKHFRDLENCVRSEEDETEDGENIQRFFTKTWNRIHRVCMPPYKRTTLCGMLACLLHFPGFTWLALWNTHVLQELEGDDAGNGNGTCNVDVQSVALGFLQDCDVINEARFELAMLISLGYVVGEMLLVVGIDIIGRKPFLISSALAGGAASLVLVFRVHRIIRAVLSSIFLAAYAIGRTTTCVLLLENYPTALRNQIFVDAAYKTLVASATVSRGTMTGLTKILPHLVVFATQLVLRTSCLLSIIVASTILIGAAFVMLPVPDLTKLPMKE